jgi:hypothetical protein
MIDARLSASVHQAREVVRRVALTLAPLGTATDEFRLREPSMRHRVGQLEVLSVRKVIVYELLSLDGVAEDPDAFITDWDEVMDANLAAVIAAQDAVILGRRSYGEWAEFWPDSNIQPFATFINGVAKFVRHPRRSSESGPMRLWSTAAWPNSSVT